MRKKFWFDPAWVIFFMVVLTLVVIKFMDDEQMRNVIASVTLVATALLFFSAVLVRSLTDRIG
jgi:uncharacterized membrane protein